MSEKIRLTEAVIDYIENHLWEIPDLDSVAEGLHYSKYHLHRTFTDITGLTIHNYIRRRRLTEAAKLLVFSRRPILEIALLTGYGSRQAFTDIFKAMYKKPPNQYREEQEFYPLQLRYSLHKHPSTREGHLIWRQRITCAADTDIPQWMELVSLVIDGFPHLDESQYLIRLREYIRNRQALIVKDKDNAVGIMAFNEAAGSIDFLGIHPQYRKKGLEQAFCEKALYELARPDAITITTFRKGDKADTGYRKTLTRLGFAEAELLVEFGYPTQRFILRKK